MAFSEGVLIIRDQEMIKRKIASTNKGIDKLVYELYGLTEDEIMIVEA